MEGDTYSSKVGLIVSYSGERFFLTPGQKPVATPQYRQVTNRQTHIQRHTQEQTQRESDKTEQKVIQSRVKVTVIFG